MQCIYPSMVSQLIDPLLELAEAKRTKKKQKALWIHGR